MKRHSLYSIIICSTSFLLLGSLLFYPLLSHEAVPNDSIEDYIPRMDYSTNIQCKRVVIDPTVPRLVQSGVKGGTTAECPNGYVAVGINNNALNPYNATTETWLFDTNPDSWGATVQYVQGTMGF